MQKEKESVHQDDHHPAALVEQSLGTSLFTKTIIMETTSVHCCNELRTFAV